MSHQESQNINSMVKRDKTTGEFLEQPELKHLTTADDFNKAIAYLKKADQEDEDQYQRERVKLTKKRDVEQPQDAQALKRQIAQALAPLHTSSLDSPFFKAAMMRQILDMRGGGYLAQDARTVVFDLRKLATALERIIPQLELFDSDKSNLPMIRNIFGDIDTEALQEVIKQCDGNEEEAQRLLSLAQNADTGFINCRDSMDILADFIAEDTHWANAIKDGRYDGIALATSPSGEDGYGTPQPVEEDEVVAEEESPVDATTPEYH